MKAFHCLFLTVLVCLVGFRGYSQVTDTISNFPWDAAREKIIYSEIDSSILKKEELLKNAKTWIANNTNSYKAVIQFEDKDGGKIVAKLTYTDPNASMGHMYFYTLGIDVKDNKYRIQLYDIISRLLIAGAPSEKRLEDIVLSNIKNAKNPKSKGRLKKYFEDNDYIFRTTISSLNAQLKKRDDF